MFDLRREESKYRIISLKLNNFRPLSEDMYADGKVKEIRKPTFARANKMGQVFDNKLGLSVIVHEAKEKKKKYEVINNKCNDYLRFAFEN